MLVARLERPLVVELLENRSAARLQRPDRIAFIEGLLERAGVDEEAPALECHGLARGRQITRRRTERLPQLGQRDPQAGTGRLVEHVGPEARSEAASWMGAGVERKVGQHRARPLRCRQSEFGAIHA